MSKTEPCAVRSYSSSSNVVALDDEWIRYKKEHFFTQLVVIKMCGNHITQQVGGEENYLIYYT